MPYKSDKVRIAGTRFDLRRKLTEEQVRSVSKLGAEGMSQRELARMFGVSKSLIQYILHPSPRNAVAARSTEYCNAAKRRHRARKHELYKSGALEEILRAIERHVK